MRRNAEEVFLFVVGLAVLLVLTIYAIGDSSERNKFTAICEYEGGVVKDDVCLVDDKVYPIEQD